MAEETKTTVTETTPTTDTANPTVEELMAQLAAAKADAEKYKTANDKLSKSEADMKRQLRAKQTAEEQAEAAQKEAQELADKERDELRAELNQIKAEKAYKGVADDKSIQKLIDAVSNSDHAEIARIIEAECKRAVANAEATWLNNRPPVNAGAGDGSPLTKQDIMAIKDASERRKAIAENIELFNGGN